MVKRKRRKNHQPGEHALDGGPAVRRFDRNRQEIEAIRCVGDSANPQTKRQREAPSRMADRRAAMVTAVKRYGYEIALRDTHSYKETIMAKTFGAESTTDDVLDGVDLAGKRILVTGVSAGLGVETARALAAHGALVVGAARDLDKARQV